MATGTDVLAELSWRGLVHQTTTADLGAHLAREPVVAYHGIDATAPSLHVGNLLGVLALQRLQQAGHRPIALVGGATSLIGDPSGKVGERPMSDAAEVEANVAAIRAQLDRFLDFGDRSGAGSGAAVVVNNADWLGSVTLVDFLRDVGKHFSVNVMLAKESVRARLEAGISFTEFAYMLLQASDFLHLHDTFGCRLQVGGSDQWGNITAGCELVRRVRETDVWGLTWPLLTRPDGSKFGKSESGNVWLDPALTSPYEFSQFWLRADDGDVIRLLRQFTSLSGEEIAALEDDVAERPAQRSAQRTLARSVTTAVHGPEAARAAEAAAQALFGGDLGSLTADTLLQIFAEAPSSAMARGELDGPGLDVVDVLVRTGLSPSRSAARNAVVQGGAYVNNQRVESLDRRLTPTDLLAGGHVVVRRGQRHHALVRFG